MEILGFTIEKAKKKPACQYVDMLGRPCKEVAVSSCCVCDLSLCAEDAWSMLPEMRKIGMRSITARIASMILRPRT